MKVFGIPDLKVTFLNAKYTVQITAKIKIRDIESRIDLAKPKQVNSRFNETRISRNISCTTIDMRCYLGFNMG